MKKLTLSFLFYLVSAISIFLLPTFNGHSQMVKDSTNYYHKVVLNAKSHDSLLKGYLFFSKQKEQNLRRNNKIKALYNLRMIAIAQIELGLIYEAEVTTISGLNLIDNLSKDNEPFINDRIGLYNSLGRIYRLMKKHDKAIDIYHKALKITTKNKDSVSLHNNIGNVLKAQGKYKYAENHLKVVLRERLKSNNKQLIAKALDNLGSVQGKLNDEKGLKNMLQALSIRKQEQDVKYYYASYKHLTEYYKDRGIVNKAREYAKLGYEAANKYTESYLEDALPRMLELNNDNLVKEYVKLNDSLLKARFLINEKYASAKYNLNQEKQKTFETKLQKERQEKLKFIYLFLGLSISVILISLILILRSKYKKEKIEQVFKTETRISKKIHDELANDMSDLMNFVENDIEVTQSKKSLLLDNIEDIYIRTRDISTETGSIDFANFSDSIKHLLIQHNRSGTKVVTNNINIIDWKNIAEHKKAAIYRCLQELLVNMKKHSNAKVVSIVFKNYNKKKEIRYVDDGIGFSIEETKLNGLSNVGSRIKGIGGSFNFTTSKGNGFKATLEFNS